jgi:Mrp family chromosome partitioning ATPase
VSIVDSLTVIVEQRSAFRAGRSSAIENGARTLQRVAKHYDLVVLDMGPLTADAHYVYQPSGGGESAVNAAIVVRDCRRTSEASTLAAVLQLKNLGVQAVGIAENYSSPHSALAAA